MELFIKANPEELTRAKTWWQSLESQWKVAFNEAVFGKGPILEPPKDEELIVLLVRATALRFAGPFAYNPNLTQAPNNLSGVKALTHLDFLSFTDSPITSLKEISGLTKLRHLFVYNNKIESLEGIENMLELEELYCQHNKITSLKPIEKLTGLKTLYVSNNMLTSLEGLKEEHSDNLRKFYVEPNESLHHRELIKVQNNFGILCRRG